jgi:hypothetical protein
MEQYADRCELVLNGYTRQQRIAATMMQSLWRSLVQRKYFKSIIKGVRMQRTAEQDYLDDPDDVVKLMNYVLYLHTFPHDYARARRLYERAVAHMEARGPDNGYVLFNYAIFLQVHAASATHTNDSLHCASRRTSRRTVGATHTNNSRCTARSGEHRGGLGLRAGARAARAQRAGHARRQDAQVPRALQEHEVGRALRPRAHRLLPTGGHPQLQGRAGAGQLRHHAAVRVQRLRDGPGVLPARAAGRPVRSEDHAELQLHALQPQAGGGPPCSQCAVSVLQCS